MTSDQPHQDNAQRIPAIFSDVSVEVVGYVEEDGSLYIQDNADIAGDITLPQVGTGASSPPVTYAHEAKVMNTIRREGEIPHSTLLRRLSYLLNAAQLKRVIGKLVQGGMVQREQRGRQGYYRWVGGGNAALREETPIQSATEDGTAPVGFTPVGELSAEELRRQRAEPLEIPRARMWAYKDLCAFVAFCGPRPDRETLVLRVKEAVLETKQRSAQQQEALRRKVDRLEASLEWGDTTSIPQVQRRQMIYSPLRRKWLLETPEEKVRQEYVVTLQTDYGYSPECMQEEVEVTGAGSGSARADLVVWATPTDKTQGRPPLIVVECKSPGTPLSPEHFWQGENYARLAGATFLVTTNGRDIRFWAIEHDKMPKSLREVDNIPACAGA